MILVLRAMWREAPKFETGQDKTKTEAGKIKERADTGGTLELFLIRIYHLTHI